MEIKIEIYLKDLTKEKQKEVMNMLGLEKPTDENFDITPLFELVTDIDEVLD